MSCNLLQHNKIDALFVGYENQENLGLRSIMAFLDKNGYKSMIVPFVPDNFETVISAVKEYSPALIGFSVIFQYTLNDFANLISSMRKEGIKAHFTVGGHFPSMRPTDVLSILKGVDSVVRFEGEETTLELLQKLNDPESWLSIQGLVFRKNSSININPPRPLINDLDSLPLPKRSNFRYTPQGIKIASILASRGCYHNCSFCSIRQFYATPPGLLRRTRSPGNVAAEMRELYIQDKVQFFIFQDDDFATRSPRQRKWVDSFLSALDDENLSGKIAWRIACRVDDVDEELFIRCKNRGLTAVYLGVESGNNKGLQTLNKQVTVEKNLSAIKILKKINLPFEIGFMLFDPDSTVETLKENIQFLRKISGDGSFSIPFCKMLPYAGTPIEKRLLKEGRLKGTLCNPDYDFLDKRLDLYTFFVSKVFRFRNYNDLGLVERLRAARAIQMLNKFLSDLSNMEEYEEALIKIIAKSNIAALNTLEVALEFIEERDINRIVNEWYVLDSLAEFEHNAEMSLLHELDQCLKKYNPNMFSVYQKEYLELKRNKKPLNACD